MELKIIVTFNSKSDTEDGNDGTNGTDGIDGIDGVRIQVARANGYNGTEEQWLQSLKGVDGTPGNCI